jgi:ribosomal protein L9
LYLEQLQLHCHQQQQQLEQQQEEHEHKQGQQVRKTLQELIKSLFKMNSQKCYQIFATVGSEKFGEKLRCWQSLCVLIHSIDSQLCQQISSQVIGHLSDAMAHGIRVHVEIFCAKLLEKFPEIMLPPLLGLLRKFHHSQQV